VDEAESSLRRDWLDHFPYDLVIVEGPYYETPEPAEVQQTIQRQGRTLTATEAMSRALEAVRLATALELRASGVSVVPPSPMPNGLDQALVDLVRNSTRVKLTRSISGTPLGRSVTVSTIRDLWNTFFYWFSGPDRRTGAGLNYGACRAQARAYIHQSGFTVLDCRRSRESPLMAAASNPAGQQ
jgi:hypothetical protein